MAMVRKKSTKDQYWDSLKQQTRKAGRFGGLHAKVRGAEHWGDYTINVGDVSATCPRCGTKVGGLRSDFQVGTDQELDLPIIDLMKCKCHKCGYDPHKLLKLKEHAELEKVREGVGDCPLTEIIRTYIKDTE